MTKNTKGIIWANVAVMMVVISIVTYVKQKPHYASTKTVKEIQNQAQVATLGSDVVSTSTATSTLTTSIITTRKPKPIPPKALSYGDAVAKYTDHRIQFNSICQAIPGQVVFANFTTIMLDNRSDGVQKITIAGKTYTVPAYDYVLVTLKQKVLPITLHVNCNNQMNAVEITVG